ncbi:MAG: hypothetical protein WEF28_09225 [Acidimicrobiia bacterium]
MGLQTYDGVTVDIRPWARTICSLIGHKPYVWQRFERCDFCGLILEEWDD